jgi:hypothetical protein
LTSQPALASCNPKDIKEQSNGTYVYPVDCHVDYGRLRQNEEARKKQVEHLKESIKLKDLALDYSNRRIETWQNATYKMEDRLIRLEKNNDRMKWVYFGLGIIVMSGAVYTAKQLK